MTIIRIAALAFLLGSSVTAMIWFGWGAIQNLIAGNATPSEPEREPDRPAKPGRAA